MSYCCSGRSRLYTSLGDDVAPIPVPIFAPGTSSVASLQIAMNRLIEPSLGRIADVDIDGIMGPQTLKMMQLIASTQEAAQPDLGGALSSRSGSQAALVANADYLTQELGQIADSLNLPQLALKPMGPFAPGDKAAPPRPPRGTPGIPDMGMSSTTMVMLAVGAGVALALVTKRKGRKR